MAISLNEKYKYEERYKAVVEHNKGILVVSAGPGTGKTYSLLRKIESLLNKGVDPSKIYYLTFVNGIVDAFKKDIIKDTEEGGLGKDPEDLGIKISTLHSLAFKIIKTYAKDFQLPEDFEIIDFSPKPENILSKLLISDLYNTVKSNYYCTNKNEFNSRLDKIILCWRENREIPISLNSLYKQIDLLCNKFKVCPWDNLVQISIRAIKKYGLPSWLKNIKYFLIDEYQDFNPAEQHLISRIIEPSDSIVIVGDPDQSIYSGRGASPTGLEKLIKQDNVFSVNFVYCRRCPKKIIASANNLLRYMDPVNYDKKKLNPFKNEEGYVDVKILKSCKAEIDYLAKYINYFQNNKESEIILLFASKKAKNFYYQQLLKAGIVCDNKTYDKSEELLSVYLKLILMPSLPILDRSLVNYFPKFEKKFTSCVLPIFLKEKISFVDAVDKAYKNNRWMNDVIEEFKNYKAIKDKLASMKPELIAEGLKELNVILDIDYIKQLLSDEINPTNREKVEFIIKQIREQEINDSAGNLKATLLTMHSSKGLDKNIVIIPAFEDKLLPGQATGKALAEKHRLIYVAITRSKKNILITFPETRAKKDPLKRSFQHTINKISRYANIINSNKV